MVPQFQKFEKTYLKFQKNLKKSCTFSMIYTTPCKILMQYTWGFEIHKNDKSWRFETVHCSLYSDLYICHFCIAQTQNYFALKICTLVVYIIENVHDLFSDFFETFKYVFLNFQNCGITEAREHEISYLRVCET